MKEATKRGTIISLNAVCNTAYNMESAREQNVIGRRIKEGRHNLGMSLDAFSKHLKDYGVSVGLGGLNKWETGATIPNSYQLIALSYALGVEQSLDYFVDDCHRSLSEEGMEKVASFKAYLIGSGRYTPDAPVADAPGAIKYVKMPVSDLCVSAGLGNFMDEGNFELISFPAAAVPHRADFGVRISGDSMEPVYHDRQIVWVEQCDHLDVGDVGVFIYDNEGYLKVYSEQQPAEDVSDDFTDSMGNVRPQPVLISYNPNYPPKVISPNYPFQILGKVL